MILGSKKYELPKLAKSPKNMFYKSGIENSEIDAPRNYIVYDFGLRSKLTKKIRFKNFAYNFRFLSLLVF